MEMSGRFLLSGSLGLTESQDWGGGRGGRTGGREGGRIEGGRIEEGRGREGEGGGDGMRERRMG